MRWGCATCSKAVSGNRPIGSALQGNYAIPHPAHIFGQIALPPATTGRRRVVAMPWKTAEKTLMRGVTEGCQCLQGSL